MLGDGETGCMVNTHCSMRDVHMMECCLGGAPSLPVAKSFTEGFRHRFRPRIC